jgi:hypothetical protein
MSHIADFDPAYDVEARCDACGRQLAPADLVGWDAIDNDLAGEHTDANDLLWICRCCRDDRALDVGWA